MSRLLHWLGLHPHAFRDDLDELLEEDDDYYPPQWRVTALGWTLAILVALVIAVNLTRGWWS